MSTSGQDPSDLSYLLLHRLSQALRLASLLKLLNFRLPVVLGVKAEHLPRLLDTNQSLPWVISLGVVFDTGEDLLDKLGCRGGECNVGIGDVEDMSPLQLALDSESEALGTVPSVDIAESAIRVSSSPIMGNVRRNPLPSTRGWVFLELWEPSIVLWGHDITQSDIDDLQLWVPSAVLLRHLLAHKLGERVARFRSFHLFGNRQFGRAVGV